MTEQWIDFLEKLEKLEKEEMLETIRSKIVELKERVNDLKKLSMTVSWERNPNGD